MELSHFDCYSDFSILEAGYLAAGIDPYATGQHVHGDAVVRALERGFRLALFEIRRYDIRDRSYYRSEALVPRALDPENIDWPPGVPMTWLRNGEPVERTFAKDSDQVRFTREEIDRWLRANGVGLVPKYPFSRSLEDSGPPTRNDEVGERERGALLRTIAVMLEMLMTPRDGRTSQAAVIDEMTEMYGEKDGIAKSTLEKRFAEARRRLLP